MRHLIFILRDQLDRNAAVLADADPDQDAIVMTEAGRYGGRYTEHKQRLVQAFSAMRHFADEMRDKGWTVYYQTADDCAESEAAYLKAQIEAHQPERALVTEPGRYDLISTLTEAAEDAGAPLDVYADQHFLCTHEAFEEWADGRSSLTMEYFYREQRRTYDCLMTADGDPEGGEWNFDEDNRESFDQEGPGDIKAPIRFQPDDTTRAVMEMVEAEFPDAPGALDSFAWPVTHEEAQRAVRDFIEYRLPTFGTYQDAMWTERPFLYHSRISGALNLKLIDPRYVIDKAEEAYHEGHAPINAVEGFIRQILGWREFIRAVYWMHMPGYDEKNALNADADLPALYWTADTHMTCMRESLGQVVEHAYGHHIQRLMVTGLFGLMYGIDPQALNDWHKAMYIDAWDWVSTPNMVGMSQYADGGIVGTKPYSATGKYINRMSNYCRNCMYDPDEATGDDACPFTTLYWDFLSRHEDEFSGNRRMNFQMANVRRKSDEQLEAIAERAKEVHALVENGEL